MSALFPHAIIVPWTEWFIKRLIRLEVQYALEIQEPSFLYVVPFLRNILQ